MILGLGSDIVSMERIQKTIEKYGSRFESRVFEVAMLRPPFWVGWLLVVNILYRVIAEVALV